MHIFARIDRDPSKNLAGSGILDPSPVIILLAGTEIAARIFIYLLHERSPEKVLN